MKRCRSCMIEYPDRYYECPTCGEELIELEEKREGNEHSTKFGKDSINRVRQSEGKERIIQENDRTSSYTYQRIENETESNQRRENEQGNSAIEFERQGLVNTRFNGIVSQVSVQQNRQTAIRKIFRAIFAGETYQFGQMSYTTVFRVEEMTTNRYAERSRDVVLYGQTQSILVQGDDVTVTAKRRGNRYIAEQIYNNTTDSNVQIQHGISAGIIRLIVLVILVLLGMFIGGIATADYSMMGNVFLRIIDKFWKTIIIVGIIWYCISKLRSRH